MNSLTPIDVEFYEHQFKLLSENIGRAADLLIPDAYEMEKDQLLSAKQLVDKHSSGFNEVLNLCSTGVLFNESTVIGNVETNVNLSVVGILWSCQDIISSILLLNEDFSEYVNNISFLDPMVNKLGQFFLTESQFNFIADDLFECSKLIMTVLIKLDGYNI